MFYIQCCLPDNIPLYVVEWVGVRHIERACLAPLEGGREVLVFAKQQQHEEKETVTLSRRIIIVNNISGTIIQSILLKWIRTRKGYMGPIPMPPKKSASGRPATKAITASIHLTIICRFAGSKITCPLQAL